MLCSERSGGDHLEGRPSQRDATVPTVAVVVTDSLDSKESFTTTGARPDLGAHRLHGRTSFSAVAFSAARRSFFFSLLLLKMLFVFG